MVMVSRILFCLAALIGTIVLPGCSGGATDSKQPKLAGPPDPKIKGPAKPGAAGNPGSATLP
jgi:hypothetical protein